MNNWTVEDRIASFLVPGTRKSAVREVWRLGIRGLGLIPFCQRRTWRTTTVPPRSCRSYSHLIIFADFGILILKFRSFLLISVEV